MLAYIKNSNSSSTVSEFFSNFANNHRIGIFEFSNSSNISTSTYSCSLLVIEAIEANPYLNRNASTIDYYVGNLTGCTYEKGGIGKSIGNFTNASISDCLAMINNETSIVLVSAPFNKTVITSHAIYIAGNAAMMEKCPISYEI
ncbi:MAG: hypothetical protein ACP5RP_00910 [Candidatus Micrarchaeia archaeon]